MTAPTTSSDGGATAPGPVPPAPTPEFPGYEVRGELGRGGMGVVYEAFDRRRGAVVALKTLQRIEPAALYRFKREFRALADLTHENLVALYELHSDGERWYFTMERLDGLDFVEHVRRGGDLRAALRQLAAAVAALHGAGRLHRDVKPSNVIVTRGGCVKLLDFGLAAEIEPGGEHLSTQRHVLGTAAYMAPEQALGRSVSPASDWYSVGVVLYEALTGKLPFSGTAVEMLVAKQGEDARPPSSSRSSVPPDLDALCVRLLAREPSARPGADAVLSALAAHGAGTGKSAAPATRTEDPAPRLVGRERHLEVLSDAFDAVKSRRSVVVFLHGASGVGKTALATQFLERVAQRDGAVVLSGRCYERESLPHKALDSPIDALSRHLARLPTAEARGVLPRDVLPLTRVFPVLRRVEAVAEAAERVGQEVDARELRRRAAHGLRELLGRLGDARPLVLHADDVQWGDADSATLLAEVMRPPDPPVLLLVFAYRTDDAERSPFLGAVRASLARGEWACETRDLVVDPLTQREAQRLAESLLGAGADERRATEIARESQGNPFFVEELARWTAGAGRSSGPSGVSLTDVVVARLDALPPPSRRLLDAIVVAGRPVDPSVAFVAAGGGGDWHSALGALRAAHLVRSAGTGDVETIDVLHDRVRETALARIRPEDVRELHRRLGLALEATGAREPEILALHFLGAGESERASGHLEQAGDAALVGLAPDHAAQLYRQALGAAGADASRRRRLNERLGEALTRARRGAEAAEAFLAAAGSAEGGEAMMLRLKAASGLLTSGRVAEWYPLVAPVFDSLGLRFERRRWRALAELALRRARIALRGLEPRPITPGGAPHETSLRLEACWTVTTSLFHSDPVPGFAMQSIYLEHALRSGDPLHVVRAISVEAAYRSAEGIRGAIASDRIFERALDAAGRSGQPRLTAIVLVGRCSADLVLGRWRSSFENAGESLRLLREHGVGQQWEFQVAMLYRLMACDFLGRLRELATLLREAEEDAELRDDVMLQIDLATRVRHLPLLVAHDATSARELLDAVTARIASLPMAVQRYRALESRAHTALYGGDADEAWRLAETEWANLHWAVRRVAILETIAREAQARAALAMAERSAGSERSGFLRSAERSARRVARVSMPYVEHSADALRAAIAHLRGHDDEAVRRLASAEQGYAANDMALYAAACRRRRGVLLGGDEGRSLVESSDAAFRAQDIRRPDRWTAMYVPGFDAP